MAPLLHRVGDGVADGGLAGVDRIGGALHDDGAGDEREGVIVNGSRGVVRVEHERHLLQNLEYLHP